MRKYEDFKSILLGSAQNHIIEEYFKGNKIKKSSRNKNKKITDNITLNTPLLECGFSFNQKFRDYFSGQTGITPFKFNADMAEAWRKVKRKNDKNFTIKDMLHVYNGDSHYAKYDNSTNQWNWFVKDFNLDERSDKFSNKMKVASILWNEVKESKHRKVYSKELLSKYADKIKEYRKGVNSTYKRWILSVRVVEFLKSLNKKNKRLMLEI